MTTKTKKQVETNGFHTEDVQEFALTKDEIKAAAGYTREEMMAMVGMYYGIQKLRVGASNKASAHNRKVDMLSDTSIILRMKTDLFRLEKEAAKGMAAYANNQPLGRWAMSNIGVGPVIAAGLLAHIDVVRAQTAGAIWNFAGLNPDIEWDKGQKRPYNAALKRLCWILGECFKRASNHPDCFYGKLYRSQKEKYVERNETGKHAENARKRLARAKQGKWRISDEQRETWGAGKLQASGLDLMAMRYAVKIFLSHYHQVGRSLLGLEIPKPWVLVHGGHVHMIEIPNWPMEE